VLHGVLFVVFGILVGAIAGGLIGARWGTSLSFWIGIIVGALLGGAAAGLLAKRAFFTKDAAENEPAPLEPTPGAPRWPGVEEQFQKIRFRLRVLFVLLIAPFLFLAYLKIADDLHWPVPPPHLRPLLTWGSLGITILAAALMLLTIRCPKCGGILWRAAELYECPHCGIVLRD
jgi:MFS family permease